MHVIARYAMPLIGCLSLAACGVDETPRTSTVIVTPPAQPQIASVVPTPAPLTVVAPTPPPPPQSELVPPPPPGSGPVVWQPGHWAYTGAPGSPWSWIAGRYVPPPPGQTTWIPGQWQQDISGSWHWLAGHWA